MDDVGVSGLLERSVGNGQVLLFEESGKNRSIVSTI